MTPCQGHHYCGRILNNSDVIEKFLRYNRLKNVTNVAKNKFFEYQIKYGNDLQNERFRSVQQYSLSIYSTDFEKNIEDQPVFSFIY